MKEGLIYTNDRCIGCNKCVRICSSEGASISQIIDGKPVIRIDHSRCVNCGACIEVCGRNAREYKDDTEQFMRDLAAGEEISMLVAPSFFAYEEDHARILGSLKKLGVRRFIPVALGADICTWAYLQAVRKLNCKGYISTTCPVVVSYVEHCMPSLLDRLMPIKSPMLCAAVYARKVLGIRDRLAFMGPCLAKHMEVEQNPELVQYNLTFDHLSRAVGELADEEESVFSDPEFGLGAFYPAPGGLAENYKWFLGDDIPIRVVSGKNHLFRWMRKSERVLAKGGRRYALIDILNCTEGCIEGNEMSAGQISMENDGLYHLSKIRRRVKNLSGDSPWNPNLTPVERLENLDRQFAHLDLEDYFQLYYDRSIPGMNDLPTDEQLETIFLSMHKITAESRMVDCSACGHETCRDMAVAIHRGFNQRENCIYFRAENELILERMALYDPLTRVLNRNALERQLRDPALMGRALGVVVADVNGLKAENDTKGHAAGDRLIRETAQALAEVYGTDCVYRTGGDEFLVVTSRFGEAELGKSLETAREKLGKARVSAALGMAYCECYEGDLDPTHDRADVGMYQDKARYYERTGKKRRA